jgi:hypothetical protein
MKNWLRFLWEEEATSAPTPGATRAGGASGVPALLRRATRWSAIALVGATLTGQIIGVRLIARVDADDSYQLQCRNDCLAARSRCLKTSSLAACQAAYNVCLQRCAAGGGG